MWHKNHIYKQLSHAYLLIKLPYLRKLQIFLYEYKSCVRHRLQYAFALSYNLLLEIQIVDGKAYNNSIFIIFEIIIYQSIVTLQMPLNFQLDIVDCEQMCNAADGAICNMLTKCVSTLECSPFDARSDLFFRS